MNRILNWLERKLNPDKPTARVAPPRVSATRPPAAKSTPKSNKPELVEFSKEITGSSIDDGGPGKNILVRRQYLREETGTHESLKIVDDSVLEPDDDSGFDPYNTGQFDRAKTWNNRTRK